MSLSESLVEDQPILNGRVILMVDDEKFTSALVKSVLLSLGAHDVLCAMNGADAAAALRSTARSQHIDLVISDIDMPQVGGLLLLKAIRCGRASVDRAQPVILLTGCTAQDVVAKAAALDVTGFLAKPITKGGLIQAAQRALSRRIDLKPADQYLRIDVRSRNVVSGGAASVGLDQG